MNADEREYLEGLFDEVVGAAFEVANVLGAGFLEKVYERALSRELTMRGFRVRAQAPIKVMYKGQYVGNYLADLLVENRVIVELKCVDRLTDENLAQCLNYMRAAGLHLGLLVSFQKPRLQWKRVVLNF